MCTLNVHFIHMEKVPGDKNAIHATSMSNASLRTSNISGVLHGLASSSCTHNWIFASLQPPETKAMKAHVEALKRKKEM